MGERGRSWSAWFALRVEAKRSPKIPSFFAKVDGLAPEKITNPGFKRYVEDHFSWKELG